MKYCENCGSALKKGVKFCSSCGAEIKVANVKVIETITSTKTDTKDVYPIDFNAINKRVSIQNSQSKKPFPKPPGRIFIFTVKQKYIASAKTLCFQPPEVACL